MKKIILLFSLCIAISANVFAQDEDESYVYVASGCNKDMHYHQSRFWKETKFCRHEHDKAATKKCPDNCLHMGHMEAIALDKAESVGRTPCPKCCDKTKGKKNKKKKK